MQVMVEGVMEGWRDGGQPHSLTEGGTDVEKGSNLEAAHLLDQHPLTVLTQFGSYTGKHDLTVRG